MSKSLNRVETVCLSGLELFSKFKFAAKRVIYNIVSGINGGF